MFIEGVLVSISCVAWLWRHSMRMNEVELSAKQSVECAFLSVWVCECSVEQQTPTFFASWTGFMLANISQIRSSKCGWRNRGTSSSNWERIRSFFKGRIFLTRGKVYLADVKHCISFLSLQLLLHWYGCIENGSCSLSPLKYHRGGSGRCLRHQGFLQNANYQMGKQLNCIFDEWLICPLTDVLGYFVDSFTFLIRLRLKYCWGFSVNVSEEAVVSDVHHIRSTILRWNDRLFFH